MSDQSALFRLEPAAFGRNRECKAFSRSKNTTAILIYGLCISVLLVLILLSTKEVAHKATMPGRTSLVNGDLKLYTDSRRRLTKLQVRVGDHVTAGQPLALLAGLRSQDQQASAQHHLDSLTEELQRLRKALSTSELQHRLEREFHAANKKLESQAAIEQVQEKKAVQALLLLNVEQLERGKRLKNQGHISLSALTELDVKATEQRRNLAALENSIVQSQRQSLLRDQEFERRQYAQLETKRRQFAELARLEREIQRIEHREQQTLVAPVQGQVTGVLGSIGATFDTQQPVISMISEGADYRAELWAPSKAAGALALGQPVNLLIDAFPHQRHGMLRGTIAHINSSPLTLRELGVPWETNRVAYGVTVTMDSSHPLYRRIKPGMQLTADVKLDDSTLFERLFDPLITAVQRTL